MYDSKFYGYVVSTALKQKEEEKPQAADIDFRKKRYMRNNQLSLFNKSE